MTMPHFRTALAMQDGVEKNLLFRTWGGVGDQICAEPTLRWATKNFASSKVSLSSEIPDLFSHLNFHKVFNEKEVRPRFEDYLMFETITPPDDTNLVWQFFSHCLTNCVDFPALCALRMQLPIKDREIFLMGTKPKSEIIEQIEGNAVFVHAGKHWPSKTFPKDWWDETIKELLGAGLRPVLLGADTDDNRGTVDLDASACVDLRNRLTISESVWLLQRAKVLLTNDSSPLHMAASSDPLFAGTGHCHIKYIATCKHPDFITHYRKGKFQYREENLGLGGMWEFLDHSPNQDKDVRVDQVSEETLRSWLPTPEFTAAACLQGHNNFWDFTHG